jgi:hypothetical protein
MDVKWSCSGLVLMKISCSLILKCYHFLPKNRAVVVISIYTLSVSVVIYVYVHFLRQGTL